MTDPLAQLPDSIEVVSFDVFDTLLGRTCALPEDVFRLLEAALCEQYGGVFTGFAVLRAGVDTRARRRAWDRFQREEISLLEIYELLLEEHPDWPLRAAMLVERELACERSQLYSIDRGRRWLERARAAGKRVILVSDMYLPEDFLAACLADHGFGYYERLFLSSTVGKLKHSGQLFDHVLESLGVAADRILHIGDNPHSDGAQPRSRGMQAQVVDNALDCLKRADRHPLREWLNQPDRSLTHNLLLGLAARGALQESDRDDPFWYRIGYQYAGPLLYGYVRFICQRLRGRGIRTVYFLSRDGYILRQVYDQVRGDDPQLPRSEYLYASRRALNFAAITHLDPVAENWLAEGIRLTVGGFLRRIHMDPQAHLPAILECGFSGTEHPVVGGHEYTQLRQLYRRIEPAIVAAAAVEREAYLDYLQGKGVGDSSPTVLVDVGWMTSIQHSFARLLQLRFADLHLEGFYLGTYPEARVRSGPRSIHQHYLMEYGEPEAMRIIRHCVCLIEFFFAAPETTFLRMIRDADGQPQPQLAEVHENAADLAALQQIHEGIIDYVTAAANAGGPLAVGLDRAVPLQLLHRLLAEPSDAEARRMGDLFYADGWGDCFHHTRMALPSGIRRLGLSKRRWKSEFKLSHWPKGYYQRLSIVERCVFRLLHPKARFDKPHG